MNDMPLTSSSEFILSSIEPYTEFDWNNLFKKYPFIVFLIDLR